jgi:hypothetical protein
VRCPNRANEKRYNPGTLSKLINMDKPIPDEVPGDLKLAGDIGRIEWFLNEGLTPK